MRKDKKRAHDRSGGPELGEVGGDCYLVMEVLGLLTPLQELNRIPGRRARNVLLREPVRMFLYMFFQCLKLA